MRIYKKPGINILLGWLFYGLISTVLVTVIFPHIFFGFARELFFLTIFIVIGVLDYLASNAFYNQYKRFKTF